MGATADSKELGVCVAAQLALTPNMPAATGATMSADNHVLLLRLVIVITFFVIIVVMIVIVIVFVCGGARSRHYLLSGCLGS